MKEKMMKFLMGLLFISGSSAHVVAQVASDVRARIEKINHEMAEAMMTGDTEKNLMYYADDAISMPNNSGMLEGKEAIRNSAKEMAASGVKVKSFETKTLYAVPCENMIVEVGTFNISFTTPGTDKAMSEDGKYLTIWETQTDGSLKIKLETWNSNTNPMEAGTTSDAP